MFVALTTLARRRVCTVEWKFGRGIDSDRFPLGPSAIVDRWQCRPRNRLRVRSPSRYCRESRVCPLVARWIVEMKRGGFTKTAPLRELVVQSRLLIGISSEMRTENRNRHTIRRKNCAALFGEIPQLVTTRCATVQRQGHIWKDVQRAHSGIGAGRRNHLHHSTCERKRSDAETGLADRVTFAHARSGCGNRPRAFPSSRACLL